MCSRPRAGSIILKMSCTIQGPVSMSFLPLARHWLLFFENHKISPPVILERPGGMRGAAGRGFGEGQRSARCDLQCDLQFRTSVLDSTRQLSPYGKGGGINRSAHSAGPGQGQIQKPSFFHEFGVNSVWANPTGGNRPRRFRKWKREHRLRFLQIFTFW